MTNDNDADKKDGNCKTECCKKGSCGMKNCSPCGIIKIIILAAIVAYAVNYFMK